jgi:hypothetical protein
LQHFIEGVARVAANEVVVKNATRMVNALLDAQVLTLNVYAIKLTTMDV